ncbi:MAG: hypothetical protein L0H25_06935 [Micrococcales bacterium]|nr:hypothetical protein [Micrococcales bacterium]
MAPGGVLRHSDDVLRPGGLARLLRGLPSVDPRVTIVGGSHSAFAVAGVLLRSEVNWEPAAITIRHRSPIRVTYQDIASARRGRPAVRADQICPRTGIVNRFGGLRSDAADLYQRIRSGDERRVLLSHIASRPLVDLVGPTDVVVAATGYVSAVQSLLPGARWDSCGRLRQAAGGASRRVLGLGLGTGRRRDAHTGGEPAFTGSIDGVWFYQNVVAPRLLELITP